VYRSGKIGIYALQTYNYILYIYIIHTTLYFAKV
jgi:hypothetical protein